LTDRESKNLSLIRKTNLSLFTILDEWNSTEVYHEIATPSGHPTLLYCGSDHSTQYLHDPHNPVQEAEQMIRDHEFRGEDITILMGFGLGYLPLCIQNRMHPDHRLFVLEANPEVILKACRLMNLTSLLNTEGVRIFTTDQMESVLSSLDQEYLKVAAGRINKLIHPPSQKIYPKSYKMVEKRIEAFVLAQQDSFRSLIGQGLPIAEAVMGNMPAIFDAAPIDMLFGRLTEKPTVIVAAGPSLDKNISVLKRYRSRFHVIAVDAALMSLKHHEIIPDVVVSVEPSPRNGKKFDPIPDALCEQITLAFCPMTHPSIPKRFPNAKFIFGNPNSLCRWSLSLMGGAAEFPYGFSVAHFAFYLAREMGANPIHFIGLDLAFSPEGDHAKHCPTAWNMDTADKSLPTVPGIHGDPLPTISQFIRMITLFEKEIRNTRARCIDASEGGAHIPGTEVMTLEEAANGCPENTWMQSTVPYHELWSKNRHFDIPKAAAVVSAFLEEAGVLEAMCRSALSLIQPISDYFINNNGTTRANDGQIEQINDIANRVDRHSDFLESVKDQMAEVVLNQFRLQYQKERMSDAARRQRLEIDASHHFFNRLIEVTERIRQSGIPILAQLQSMPTPRDISIKYATREIIG